MKYPDYGHNNIANIASSCVARSWQIEQPPSARDTPHIQRALFNNILNVFDRSNDASKIPLIRHFHHEPFIIALTKYVKTLRFLIAQPLLSV